MDKQEFLDVVSPCISKLLTTKTIHLDDFCEAHFILKRFFALSLKPYFTLDDVLEILNLLNNNPQEVITKIKK